MIEGLGKIRSPLGTILLNGETKLIVNPWAAIGTDILLISMSASTFFLARNSILKALSLIGGIWGITAVSLEVSKLASSPTSDPIQREF